MDQAKPWVRLILMQSVRWERKPWKHIPRDTRSNEHLCGMNGQVKGKLATRAPQGGSELGILEEAYKGACFWDPV